MRGGAAAARVAHNHKVAGSSPAPATNVLMFKDFFGSLFLLVYSCSMKKTMQLDFSNQIAHIEVTTMNGSQVITKTWGKDFGWYEDDARRVIDMHQIYIANLQAAGVKTSQPIEEKVILGKDKEYLVQSTEKFFDQGDLLAVLMKSTDKAEFLQRLTAQVRLLAEMLFNIPPLRREQYSADWLWLSVALDLKPQNAVIVPDQNGISQAILIDTFRPQIWETDRIELLPMPSTNPAKRKILLDEIKTGDIRFQAGRLWGYFVAIATRWDIEKNKQTDIAQIDALRNEVATNILAIIEEVFVGKQHYTTDLKPLLIADIREIINESITTGDYEGPRYVQSIYEDEQKER